MCITAVLIRRWGDEVLRARSCSRTRHHLASLLLLLLSWLGLTAGGASKGALPCSHHPAASSSKGVSFWTIHSKLQLRGGTGEPLPKLTIQESEILCMTKMQETLEQLRVHVNDKVAAANREEPEGSDDESLSADAPGCAQQASATHAVDDAPAWTDDEDVTDEALRAGAVLMGCNKFGQLGGHIAAVGQDKIWPRPQKSPAFQGMPVKHIAFGAHHTVAVVDEKDQGERVLSFGDNTFGQLGRSSATVARSGEAPSTRGDGVWAAVDSKGVMNGRKWRQVACGRAHTALLDQQGLLIVFGCNNFGQLGLGTRKDAADKLNVTDIPTPVCWQQVRNRAARFERTHGPVAQVACGAEHTVLLLATGQVLAFGNNLNGQLGREFRSFWNVREDTPLRVPVPSNQQVVQIACGYQHTVLLLANGSAVSCGNNAEGQLGIGRDDLDTNEFASFQLALTVQGGERPEESAMAAEKGVKEVMHRKEDKDADLIAHLLNRSVRLLRARTATRMRAQSQEVLEQSTNLPCIP